jgi:hypothetical protein
MEHCLVLVGFGGKISYSSLAQRLSGTVGKADGVTIVPLMELEAKET